MRKILFNDKYGLTDAVPKGNKTMTRMIIRNLSNFDPRQDWMVRGNDSNGKVNIAIFHNATYKYSIYPHYQPGEVVAVAQSYKDLGYTKEWVEQHFSPNPNANWNDPFEKKYPGWNNKMFTHSELEKVRKIEITDIKVERLQNISEDDCLKEGVWIDSHREVLDDNIYTVDVFGKHYCQWHFPSAREAFSFLIDKVSGKGTWESNPYVFAYSFELVK